MRALFVLAFSLFAIAVLLAAVAVVMFTRPPAGWLPASAGMDAPVLTLAFSGMFAAVGLQVLSLDRALLRKQRRRADLCEQCGYNVSASRNRCPECGQPFERY